LFLMLVVKSEDQRPKTKINSVLRGERGCDGSHSRANSEG